MPESIPIADLLPHDGKMLLLSKLVECDAQSITTSVLVREDGLFDDQGTVPAWIGLEYMAQTVAAYSGLRAKLRGGPPKLGFLLGTRKFESTVSEIPCGTELWVHASRLTAGSTGIAAFQCKVSGDKILQTATLSVYEPPNPEDFMQEKN